MANQDPALTVRFEALGRETQQIEEYSIESAYLVSTDAFSFTLTDGSVDMGMQPVELLLSGETVAGAQQALGRIEVTELGEDAAVCVCQGRDYISDLVENNIDTKFAVSKDTTLKTALLGALGPSGITSIGDGGDLLLRNIRTGKAPRGASSAGGYGKIKLTDIAPQAGQGAYEWCVRLVARNGATMQPSNKRSEILLSEPDYEQAPVSELRRSVDQLKGSANNILRATARRDFSKFPTHALFTGNKSGGSGKSTGLKQEYSIKDVVATIGGDLEAIVNENVVFGRRVPDESGAIESGKLYRLLLQNDSESKTADQLERVAKRAIAERLKDTLKYRVELMGHEDPVSGTLWGVNTIIDVRDEVANLYEPVWVARRRFTYSRDQGKRTELECWRKGAFVV